MGEQATGKHVRQEGGKTRERRPGEADHALNAESELAKYSRSRLERKEIYVRMELRPDYFFSGIVSNSAMTAHPVAKKLENCDLPPGSPLSKNVCTGRLRDSTSQAPSSR